MARNRIRGAVATAAIVMGLLWLTWFVVGGWQVKSGLSWAKEQMRAGRHRPARDRLAWLSAWWPRHGELEYLLGSCESSLGHTDRALTAWGKVPANSPLAGTVALARGNLLLRSQGRFTEAEAAYRMAMRGSDTPAMEARWALAVLLLWEGRLDEVHGLLEEIWRVGTRRDRIAALRELWRLDSVIVAAEEVRPILDKAAATAPDDDRAWLSRAYLAMRYGDYLEARSWLDKALRAHPDDPVVWRASLQLSLAAAEPAQAVRALEKMPLDQIPTSERSSLRAWFAANRHDDDAERSALEELVAINAGDTGSLDRLASLALLAGQVERAATLRRRQVAAHRDQDRYRGLLVADRRSISNDELRERARLAGRLGRQFEARGWLTLALEQDRHDQLARDALDCAMSGEALTGVPTVNSSLRELVGGPDGMKSATVPSAPDEGKRGNIAFVDDADAAGLSFTYHNGESPEHQIPETIGGGVAILDFDDDGWLDVYVVQGGSLSGPDNTTPSRDRLFHNRRDGTFEDVTARAGIAGTGRGYGFGAAVGDYDGDGFPDMFLSRFGSYTLFHNEKNGTFTDATARSGLGGDRDWPTSAAFADFDGDGDLDLYVCHYLAWDPVHPTICDDPRAPGRHVSCVPLGFPARSDRLYRNDGGRFVDVTESAGIIDRDGRGLGVVAADLDDDGRLDLFVANDMTANFWFRNLGNMKFEEVGHQAGVACNADGGYQAGMGVACGDLDGDGRPDLAVTNFFGESTTFYRNLGRGYFADATAAVGLKAPSRFLLGFGVTFLDANNDGCLDLATANGHIHDLRPNTPYAMPAQLLTGDSRGRLTDITQHAGAVWNVARVGRGLARADLDNDGRVDLVLIAQNAPLAYLHNKTTHAGHFLTLRLEGNPSNRDAIGARVTITAGGRRQTVWRAGGGSYLSAQDPRIHVGLGSENVAETIEVRWPSGRIDKYSYVRADTGYLLRESQPAPIPLTGFRPL